MCLNVVVNIIPDLKSIDPKIRSCGVQLPNLLPIGNLNIDELQS
jgi:hypothetical protein